VLAGCHGVDDPVCPDRRGVVVAVLEACLHPRADEHPSVDLEEEPPNAIATNIPDSIRSDFVYG
jgi:hypothetical protein